MLNDVSIDSIKKKTDYANVDVITRGAPIHNASLVFISDKFKMFIEKLRNEYDYVILDCPPVLQVSDHIHILKVVDGVLFVVAYAQTTKSQAIEAVKELKKNGANIIGSVFTKYDWKKDKNISYKNYGYYYSSNYGSIEDDQLK